MSTKRKLLVALAVFLLVIGGFVYYIVRGVPAEHSEDELSGSDPTLVRPKPEDIPSVAIAKPVGWAASEAPQAAQGLKVTRFVEGLEHPRVIYTLPNGDVIAAEADAPAGNMGGGLTAKIGAALMKRAGAHGSSPDALVLLRDANGDGVAEAKFTLRQGNGLASPSGLAWLNDTLYVANHDAVLAFPYKLGETALTGAPKKLMDLPGGGNHWMRNVVLNADGTRLYVAVGSASNIAERGIEAEKGRAAIWELNLKTGYPRQYAQGMRNPNGLGWNPATGELWAVVNERDQLGPDLVPDYLTNVPVGAHYGWPWVYYKKFDDDRVQLTPPQFIDDFVRKPEYALGAHVAPLGLLFLFWPIWFAGSLGAWWAVREMRADAYALVLGLVATVTVLYRVSLPKPLPTHRLIWGALLATTVFVVATVGLRIYLQYITQTGYTYGALATPIAFLLFALPSPWLAIYFPLVTSASSDPTSCRACSWHRVRTAAVSPHAARRIAVLLEIRRGCSSCLAAESLRLGPLSPRR